MGKTGLGLTDPADSPRDEAWGKLLGMKPRIPRLRKLYKTEVRLLARIRSYNHKPRSGRSVRIKPELTRSLEIPII